MAFLRPDADAVDGNWLNESGSNVNLYASLDETTAGDTDYIQSPANPVAEVCKVALSNPTGTLAEPFTLRYRYNNIGGARLTVRLLQGTTPVAEWTETDAGWQTKEHTLSNAQFITITDFTNLFVEFTANSTDTTLVLDLDFTTGTLDSKVTFSRTTAATYINASGLVASAAIDAPRFDYDPVTLAARGLLLEEQRTNVLLQSNGFPTPWAQYTSGGGVVSTIEFGPAPDGSGNATHFQVNRSSTAEYAELYQIIGGSETTAVHTASMWFKAHAAGDVGKQITLTMNQGVTLQSPLIVTLTANWVRYTCIGARSGFVGDGFTFGHVAGTGAATQTGTVDFWAWGGQLEAGTFASSYIPTTTVAVLRAADVASMTGTNFSSWYNASEGTLLWEGDTYVVTDPNNVMFVFLDYLSGSNIMALFRNAGNIGLRMYAVTAGGVTLSAIFSDAYAGAGKIGLAYKTNDCAGSYNGNTPWVETTSSFPATLNRMFIGSQGDAGFLNGHTKRLQGFNVRKTNTELQTLTTP